MKWNEIILEMIKETKLASKVDLRKIMESYLKQNQLMEFNEQSPIVYFK